MHKKGLFRGWSRLCLHTASLNAAESASAVATATTRAARAEAVQNEAVVAHETAESWKQVAAAATAAKEEALRGTSVTTTVAAAAARKRGDGAKRSLREQRDRCACRLVRISKLH